MEAEVGKEAGDSSDMEEVGFGHGGANSDIEEEGADSDMEDKGDSSIMEEEGAGSDIVEGAANSDMEDEGTDRSEVEIDEEKTGCSNEEETAGVS